MFFLKKSCCFFVGIMGKYTYDPATFDLDYALVDLLRQIWNFNTHTDKHDCIGCIAREQWCIEQAKKE